MTQCVYLVYLRPEHPINPHAVVKAADDVTPVEYDHPVVIMLNNEQDSLKCMVREEDKNRFVVTHVKINKN